MTTSGKDEDHSMPAFGVSGQFMMTSEEKAIHTEDFNPRKIVALTLDDSLARLFECLTLEYRSVVVIMSQYFVKTSAISILCCVSSRLYEKV